MTIILGSPRAGMSVSSMWDDSGLFELVTKHEGRHQETGKSICVVDSFPFKQEMHPTSYMGKSQLIKPNATYEWDTETRFTPGGINVHMVDEAHIGKDGVVDVPNSISDWDFTALSKHPKSNRRAKTKSERAAIKAKRKQKNRGR